ncbi:Hypothetical protein SCLAV_p0123 (plasmid) [Streptomyces clavuligerus]|uniref:Uncharacterized protein n=1 Tax=Streptomyces clavuligerus TaxID=1901 RepID=D5SI71_STRCL|nr:Hypothetical protein SCLAV_p0123 [Streptomyces clavuligerus]
MDPGVAAVVERQTKAMRELSRRAFPGHRGRCGARR